MAAANKQDLGQPSRKHLSGSRGWWWGSSAHNGLRRFGQVSTYFVDKAQLFLQQLVIG